jgi:hypothetical protein
MNEIIWKETVKDYRWEHYKSDACLIKKDGIIYIYDSSNSSLMFPVLDLFKSPAFDILGLLQTHTNDLTKLRDDVNFLFANQSAQFLEMPAVVDLYKYDLVTITGERANNRGIPNKFRAIGFISENKNAGEVARAQLTGTIENQDWNWTKGEDVFLYSNTISHLTKMPDSTFIQKVAQAVTTTKLLITIKDPIILS